MRQHFILCGLGRVGGRALQYLRAAGSEVVVIDDRCTPDDPRSQGARLVRDYEIVFRGLCERCSEASAQINPSAQIHQRRY